MNFIDVIDGISNPMFIFRFSLIRAFTPYAYVRTIGVKVNYLFK